MKEFVLGDGAPTALDVDMNAVVAAMGPHFAIAEGRTVPGWSLDACPSSVPDVGLYRLATSVPGVTPLVPSTRPPPPGAVRRIVGFGLHLGESGTVTALEKREGFVPLGSASPSALVQAGIIDGMIPDPGDSGGPLFCEGERSATIFGTDSCGAGATRDDRADQTSQAWGRVDAVNDFILATQAEWTD